MEDFWERLTLSGAPGPVRARPLFVSGTETIHPTLPHFMSCVPTGANWCGGGTDQASIKVANLLSTDGLRSTIAQYEILLPLSLIPPSITDYRQRASAAKKVCVTSAREDEGDRISDTPTKVTAFLPLRAVGYITMDPRTSST